MTNQQIYNENKQEYENYNNKGGRGRAQRGAKCQNN